MDNHTECRSKLLSFLSAVWTLNSFKCFRRFIIHPSLLTAIPNVPIASPSELHEIVDDTREWVHLSGIFDAVFCFLCYEIYWSLVQLMHIFSNRITQ